MAPVIRALAEVEEFQPVVVATGQHREMLHPVLELFGIEPDFDLDVMQPDQTLASLTARLTGAIDEVLGARPVDFSIVQGDTTTAFVGALASFYREVPVGHVEAGLRTGDLSAPFPEEANRKLVSALARLHFAPTQEARANLLQEGVDDAAIEVTGNTVIDALHLELARQESTGAAAALDAELATHLGARWRDRPFVLITGHRRENFGGGFEAICGAIAELADALPGHGFVYPVHLNPNVQKPVHDALGGRANVHLLPPQDYPAFVRLMQVAHLVLSDSGGIQEEAPGLGKPVLVMRDTTERPEGVAAGTVKLVGADREMIVAGVRELVEDPVAYAAMATAVNPYGDGKAAPRVVEVLRKYFERA